MTKSGQIFGFDFRHLALDGSKNGQPEFCIWFRSCGTGLPEALFRRGEVPGGQMAFMSSNRGFFSEKKATPPSRWQVLNVPLQAASQFLMQRSQKFSTVGFFRLSSTNLSLDFQPGIFYRTRLSVLFQWPGPAPSIPGVGYISKRGGGSRGRRKRWSQSFFLQPHQPVADGCMQHFPLFAYNGSGGLPNLFSPRCLAFASPTVSMRSSSIFAFDVDRCDHPWPFSDLPHKWNGIAWKGPFSFPFLCIFCFAPFVCSLEIPRHAQKA